VAAIYFLLYSTLAMLRHRSYNSFGFDLGLFKQEFWTTTRAACSNRA
jgi:uncharacterized membrane protein